MTRYLTTNPARRRALAGTVAVAALISAALLTAGCRGKHGAPVPNDEEPGGQPPLVSSLKMNDPDAPAQLVKGFWAVESGTWRWTAKNFSVLLKTPPGASERGGELKLTLTVSDILLKQIHSQSLTASIADKPLKTEKYVSGGNYTFSADVPASALAGDTVKIDFSLDNALPPGPADLRELGVIATAVALESK